MHIQVGQDNFDTANLELSTFTFGKGDIKYIKSEKKEVFDFVGFILNDNKILSIFPKHFYNEKDLNSLNETGNKNTYDIKLLFDVIIKYMREKKSNAQTDRYFGSEPEFISDYPFASFFEVYKYFQQYGIYYEDVMEVKPNINGKIAWKQTIQKSNIIVSGGNLLFSPLYKKRKRKYNVFLSECMAFVIDHTINSFPLFIKLPKTGYKQAAFDFLKYPEHIIKQLNIIKNRVFKDSHKWLVRNLITFFEQYRNSAQGGEIHLKINYFDMIWERMVEKYLNDYFEKIDKKSDMLIFNKNILKSSIVFKSKEFTVDTSPHKFKIRLDHYASTDNAIYIFDSKYYYKVTEMNYKQFAYNELFRGSAHKDVEIYSSLILPYHYSKSDLHFSFSPQFLGEKSTGTKITEHYLKVKEVMNNYI